MAGGYVRAMMRWVTQQNANSRAAAIREAKGIVPAVTRQQRRHAERRAKKQPLNMRQAKWHALNGFQKVRHAR